MYGSNQSSIQRYMSVKKWIDASIAVIISFVGLLLVYAFTCLSGIVTRHSQLL